MMINRDEEKNLNRESDIKRIISNNSFILTPTNTRLVGTTPGELPMYVKNELLSIGAISKHSKATDETSISIQYSHQTDWVWVFNIFIVGSFIGMMYYAVLYLMTWFNLI